MIFKSSLPRENWKTKYQYKDETPLETFKRVARALAEVEAKYGATPSEVDSYADQFLQTMVTFLDYTKERLDGAFGEDLYESPQGKTLQAMGLKCTTGGRITANAGTDFKNATLLNCFISAGVKGAKITFNRGTPDGKHVIPVTIQGSEETADDLTNIMVALTTQARTLANEGGYGVNFDFIRPRGSLIKGTGVRHPGVLAYMEVWDKVADMIVRGDADGYADTVENLLPQRERAFGELEKAMPRKGAQMGCLSVWHPDIEEFIRSKQTKGKLTKFNISVLVDDAFMEAVIADTTYDLHFEGRIYKRVRAKALYDLMMEATYNRAEPGILYKGNMSRTNPLEWLGAMMATNPCGEIGGNPWLTTVCLLGSLNLTQYILADRTFDWVSYERDVLLFARMLENVNDIGNVPLDDYQWAIDNIRQYGMGINGLGSAHYMLGLTYGSKESLEFTKQVNRVKENLTWKASALLAKERGPAPAFEAEGFFNTPWFKDHADLDEDVIQLLRRHGARNLKTTTNPPLGNSSVICNNVSNGIEPVFSHGYERTIITDVWPEGLTRDNVQTVLSEIQVGDAQAWRGDFGGKTWYYEPHNRGLCFIEPVRDYGYDWVLEHFPKDIEAGAEYLVTAQELPVETHVAVQAMVQKHINQSCSKTANLPNDYPFESFKQLYIDAWKAGLNGFTTYRAGTMEAVLAVVSDGPTKGDGFVPEAGNLTRSLVHAGCTPDDAELTEANVVVRQVRLPEGFANGPTKQVEREGSKFYFHLSYLPCDGLNPIAFWIHSNRYKKGEYVTMNRACRALTKLLLASGVCEDLVLDHVEKCGEDAYHVRLGKAVSMALRHGITLPHIIKALSGVEGDYVSTTLTAARKFLSEVIVDGVEVVGATCPACCSENLIYESGCSLCRDCGNSGC